jgi:hypothetical protein
MRGVPTCFTLFFLTVALFVLTPPEKLQGVGRVRRRKVPVPVRVHSAELYDPRHARVLGGSRVAPVVRVGLGAAPRREPIPRLDHRTTRFRPIPRPADGVPGAASAGARRVRRPRGAAVRRVEGRPDTSASDRLRPGGLGVRLRVHRPPPRRHGRGIRISGDSGSGSGDRGGPPLSGWRCITYVSGGTDREGSFHHQAPLSNRTTATTSVPYLVLIAPPFVHHKVE